MLWVLFRVQEAFLNPSPFDICGFCFLQTRTHSCGGACVYTVYIYFEAQKVTVVEFFEIMMHSCGVPRWPMRVTFLLRLMLSRYSP